MTTRESVLAMPLHPSFAKKESQASRRREAERRQAHLHCPRHTVRRCRLSVRRRGRGSSGSRSPLGAPPRHLPRKVMPWLSPGRVSWDVRNRGRYPRPLSQSSEAPRRPVVMPADPMPGPPGSGVTSPARRNRTRPINRLSPVDDPSIGELKCM
jgi:hypothetical protein